MIFNDKIKNLEMKQIDFLDFWKHYGQLKNQMYLKFLKLEQNGKIEKNKYHLDEQELYEDKLNEKAGILAWVLLNDQE